MLTILYLCDSIFATYDNIIYFVSNNDPPDVSARFYFVTFFTYSISIIMFPYLNYITVINK